MKSNYTGDIEKDLPHFVLWVLASRVVYDRIVQDYLVEKAKRTYRHNVRWGTEIAAGHERERDLLVAFMEHWLTALSDAPLRIAKEEKLNHEFVRHWAKVRSTLMEEV